MSDLDKKEPTDKQEDEQEKQPESSPEEQQPEAQKEETGAEEQAEQSEEAAEPVTEQSDKAVTAEKLANASKKAAEKTGQFIGASYEKVKEYDPQTSVHLLEQILNWAREKFPPEFYDKISDWLTKYGHAGIVVAQIMALVFYMLNAMKLSRWSLIFQGIGIALLLVILQYTANKFLTAGKRLIDTTPSSLSSSAFLDCTAWLLEVIGLFVTIAMTASQGLAGFIVGLGIWALLDSIAFTAIHPSLVNVSIEEDVRAGEEAIGILSYFAKAVLKIVPIAYGVGAILGSIALIISVISLFFGKNAAAGNSAVALIIVCTCLPFLSYVAFMIYHLLIDLLRSILVIPGKLDDLSKDS